MSNALLLVLCGSSQRRNGFVRALSEAGWPRVLAAPSMAEAARMMRDATSACVIVDAELEDIPGLKAIPILRNLCQQTRIVFTAPENTRGLEAQVRALDVFYYHIGPVESGELVDAVKDAIGASTHERTGRPPKVLIVDDDPDFHESVRTLLESAGYLVVSAYSEREGLDSARLERPDLILLDIIMQTTTDGFEFCREAKRDPLIRHAPILGVSAIETVLAGSPPPDADPGLFPVDGYLAKPVAPEKLLAAVRRLAPVEQ